MGTTYPTPYNPEALFVKFTSDGATCMGYALGFGTEMMPVGDESLFNAQRIDPVQALPYECLQKEVEVVSTFSREKKFIQQKPYRAFVTPVVSTICQ